MKFLLAFPMAVLALLMVAMPALAYLDAPTSMSFPSVKAFRNVVEIGDVAVIFEYDIEYTTYPDTLASNSIIFQMFDSGDLINTATPYNFSSFETNGYNHGVGLFYFSAADALTWGSAYELRIQQLPAYYATASHVSYTMAESNYSTGTTQAENQQQVYLYVMDVIDDWESVYPTVTLKSTVDSAAILSIYGEAYFSNAIPNLQSICPALFLVQPYIPTTITTLAYNMDLAETYATRLSDSDIYRGANRLGDYFSVSGFVVLAIFTMIAAVIPPLICQRKGWGLEPGLIISAVIVILSALLVGDAIFAIVMIGSLVAAIALIFIFVLKRA